MKKYCSRTAHPPGLAMKGNLNFFTISTLISDQFPVMIGLSGLATIIHVLISTGAWLRPILNISCKCVFKINLIFLIKSERLYSEIMES